jgi:hypothetical protein
MRKSGYRKTAPLARGAGADHHLAEVTRRKVLAGAAAATAAFTIGVEPPASAQTVDANSRQDMDAFTTLSAALTGIAKAKLAPLVDPVDIKREYFNLVLSKEPVAFAALLQITKNAALPAPPAENNGIIGQADVDKLVRAIDEKKDDALTYLARSIVLMWYLGSWYKPGDLKLLVQDPKRFTPHTVISPKAYTQGWLWRTVQAHPMGFSELQFGYWTRKPAELADFIATPPVKQRKGT